MRFDPARLFAPARGASGWPRLPTVLGEAAVATSHPLATRAGVRALEAGGNAVDAALAAAAMLTVCEPGHNGPGGDLFALLWWDGELVGLNGSGRSPAELDTDVVDQYGPRSVTVPGAVAAWADLASRFGRLGLDAALAPGDRRGRARRRSRRPGSPSTGGSRPGARPGPRPRSASATACPSSRRPCAGSPTDGPRRLLPRARSPRRSPRRAGSPRRTSRRTARSGSSRSGSPTAGSRSASCRRTARARPR